ncbi:hypothetical protein REPUB_Repub15cG0112400 [Reevesia pubescens]
MEVTSSQLIASELFPIYVVKLRLYQEAFVNTMIKNRAFPSYIKLLKLYNITNLRKPLATSDLQRLEVGLIVFGFDEIQKTLMYLDSQIREH